MWIKTRLHLTRKQAVIDHTSCHQRYPVAFRRLQGNGSGHLERIIQMPDEAAETMRHPIIVHSHLDRAARADEYDKFLCPRNRGVDQITLEHS